jgi:hypothetical protein
MLAAAISPLHGIAPEQTITLSGSGSGSKSYHDPEGWWQKVDYTCTVSLVIKPHEPKRIGDVFEATLADIEGTVRFVAHAEDHFFGATTIEDHDIRKSYQIADTVAYIDFLASDRSVSWVGAPLPNSGGSAPPRIEGIKFDAETGDITAVIGWSSFWLFGKNYPVPGTAESTNRPRLVVAAHGWKGSSAGWPTATQAAIAAQLAARVAGSGIPVDILTWNEDDAELVHPVNLPTGWEIAVVDWSDRANTLLPQSAQRNGAVLGGWFGTLIQNFGYENIHVIGHSAGSWVVDAITDTVKRGNVADDRSTDIHITFLDAYAQGGTYCLLGDHGDWVEHYVCREQAPTPIIGTDWTLPWAFNIDITSLKPAAVSSHAWPPLWYLATATSPLAPAYGGGAGGPHDWGFMRSVEFAGAPPGFGANPAGRRIDLASGAELEWRPKIEQDELDLAVDPRIMAVSDPAKVTNITDAGFTLTTASPTWASFPVAVPAGFEVIRFHYEFLSSASGSLDLFIDEVPSYQASESIASGPQNSGWILLATDPPGGSSVVRFLVTAGGSASSVVRVSGIQLGRLEGSKIERKLMIEEFGGKLRVKWPRWFSEVLLQSSETLDGDWQPVPAAPDLDGDWLFIPVVPEGRSKFYRIDPHGPAPG